MTCPNFRDVGASLARVSGSSPLAPGCLLRGGRLELVERAEDIGSPATILNLRPAPDARSFGARMLHVPSEKDIERYETDNPRVRRWLAKVLRAIADDATRLPVLVHCVSGKDRTGVVVASVLTVLGAPRAAIIAEYLLSEGDVRSEWIERALDGIGNPDRYFHAVDLARLRRKLRAPP